MSSKNYVRFYLIAVGAVALALIFFISLHRSGAQNTTENTTQLNSDLIQAKADLVGWQIETAQGNLSSSDYRAAFIANLGAMKDNLETDSAAASR